MHTILVSFHSWWKLTIFLIFILLPGCQRNKIISSKEVAVIWNEGKATGISLPRSVMEDIEEDSIPKTIEVRLVKAGEQPAIAGDLIIREDSIIFEPLIPFTRGLRYRVFMEDTLYQEFEIPFSTAIPRLLSIYPGQDTLPENLLKIYLVFSKPMAANNSLQHIVLKNQRGDSLPDVFLDLQQELWNDNRTVLTLWLNPGRIKRDLQPNKMMGAPLLRGEQYELIVSAQWRDEEGAMLNENSTKIFVVAGRDEQSPSPLKWELILPTAGTNEAFEIELDEPLDYFLLKNTIQVIDSIGNVVKGKVEIREEEKKFRFIPEKDWASGLYKLEIEARLEDLAGNNLNRPFDRDVRNNHQKVTEKKVVEREWRIE